ncbi:MAG TPA: PatB family C-S lyase [Bacteroidales bacterium]|nr:PatB family C-S lyase [Bacteroidales bacterium]
MKKYDFDKVIDRKGTGSIKYDLVSELFGSDDVLPMWVADMDFEVPDFIVRAVKERAGHPIYGYTMRTSKFFESVSGWLERRHNWSVDPGHIEFSPGVVPALVLSVLAYTSPGDKILVQSPVYFPFFTTIENHKREIINNRLVEKDGEYSIDFERLEEAFRDGVKMMMFCHPHNPVGRVWTKDELDRLAKLAVKYDVLVISDEIHSDLLLFGYKHIPLASLGSEIAARTITCVAPSKTFNLAGLHTSALIIENPELRRKYKTMLDHIHIGGGNIFGFVALEAAYNHGDDWLGQLNDYLEQNYLLFKDSLNAYAPQIKVTSLQATYLVWANFKHLGFDDDALMKFFTAEAKLGCVDGARFGEGGSGYMRFNIAAPKSIIERSIDQLLAAISTYDGQ